MTRAVTCLVIAGLAVATPVLAQASCDDRAWPSVGIDAFHCPGGTCAFSPRRGPEPAGFVFSTEPWLRAIDPAGPAAGRIEEGDVLVAVNGLLITSAAGGTALGRLDPSRDAVLTVRRGMRLVETRVRPRRVCAAPLMLVGNTVLQRPGPGAPAGGADADPIIDFTIPRQLSATAVDASLGMTLRCSGCALSVHDDETRWTVPTWPVVDRVESGGVADEAGLRPGDEIRTIGGRDVRGPSSNSPLFSPPRRDFTIEYVRDGVQGSAFMNRRIRDARVVLRGHRGMRVERSERGWDAKLIGAIARWWKAIAGLDRSGGPSGRILVRDETWGPAGFGVLFRSESKTLFTLERIDGREVLTFPSLPIVAGVVPGGPGAQAGLEPGDAISNVNDHNVLEPDGARLLLFAAQREPIRLTYIRAGTVRHTTLVPSEER